MPSEYQIQTQTPYPWTSLSALSNLDLNPSVPLPSSIPPNSALVRLRAAALNARDMMVIAHDPIYPGPHDPNLVPCADGAGEIAAVGSNSIWRVGDRVLIHPNDWMDFNPLTEEMRTVEGIKTKGAGSEQGTLREFGVWGDEHLIRAPKGLEWEERAALGACGGTAVNALFYGPLGRVREGMVVLTQGTGGVSCCAIQLAAAVGATVIATSSSDEKLARAKEMGATHTVNYRTHPDWASEVLRLTNGKGVDHVIEIGGAGTIEQSIRATKQGGVISLVGFLEPKESVDAGIVGGIIFGGKSVRGVFNYTKAHIQEMVDLFEKHGLHPVVAKVFEWEDAKASFEMLNQQSAVGKIVIKVGQE